MARGDASRVAGRELRNGVAGGDEQHETQSAVHEFHGDVSFW
jgi:hypothetical protein